MSEHPTDFGELQDHPGLPQRIPHHMALEVAQWRARLDSGEHDVGGDPFEVVLITGMSGSGKSVALNALEDSGYNCVENLPPQLVVDLVAFERRHAQQSLAIAIDARSAKSLHHLVPVMLALRESGVVVRSIFLDADETTLIRRFSETRRRHPLSEPKSLASESHMALVEAIAMEREYLAELRAICAVVDTSHLRPTQLRAWVKRLVEAPASSLTLVFESFAFKHGVPTDADYVFDVRMLPNPHYVKELRPLTGRDEPVARYLEGQPEVREMVDQIGRFLMRWLPSFEQDQRHYLTVAIGCTGGQHRSVYIAEKLHRAFSLRATSLVRHREMDARELPAP